MSKLLSSVGVLFRFRVCPFCFPCCIVSALSYLVFLPLPLSFGRVFRLLLFVVSWSGNEPHDDDPPSPTYLGVGPGADWFADGGHEPIADDEPGQEFDGSHVGVLDTVVPTAPQWPSHPEF